MSSIREQIAAARIASLQAVGAPAGLNVFDERPRPIEQDKMPAILVFFEDEEPLAAAAGEKQKFAAPLVLRKLSLVLEMRAIPAPDQTVHAAIDPLYVWAVHSAAADEKFGGLAMGWVEGPMKWMSKEADVVYAGAALHETIYYRTSRLDPTAAS